MLAMFCSDPLDVARRAAGEGTIVELGDGQVAGLPQRGDAGDFFRALADHWPDQ